MNFKELQKKEALDENSREEDGEQKISLQAKCAKP